MPEQSLNEVAPAPPTRASLRARTAEKLASPADWRWGGHTVAVWNAWLAAGALISLVAAVLVRATITLVWPSPWAATIGTVLLWVGLAVPVVWALTRSRPAGLLRLHPLDFLYAVVLGGVLRVVQGWIQPGVAVFPSYPLVDGRLAAEWWLIDGVGAVVVSPAVEEFFYRAVLLIALYVILRRALGNVVAGGAALLITTGLFVLVHALTTTPTADAALSLTLLGLVCGLLVLLTGRIWGAVLVHLVFNATFVLLALTGTFLG
ncbi:CPBP family glutamic-type intramembrane protease [Microbacterium sp.]|uniref:CPBP family glutamic-type intramembrane protease n=1 Tax=Microbacterium sp. TaxID=51671 RepID=UPI0025D772B4|nr:CPBP family glutamic-type intramembrane protease [Microbacterium sp.]